MWSCVVIDCGRPLLGGRRLASLGEHVGELFLIAVIPLRRGERWAFWTLCAPLPLYGVPMLFVDGLNVVREHLLVTIAPQIGGIGLLLAGLILVGPAMFGRRRGG